MSQLGNGRWDFPAKICEFSELKHLEIRKVTNSRWDLAGDVAGEDGECTYTASVEVTIQTVPEPTMAFSSCSNTNVLMRKLCN